MNENTIAVERSGITLGWKLVVILAVAFLGIYMTTVVSPLEAELKGMRKDAMRMEAALHEQKLEIERLRTYSTVDQHRSVSVDTALNKLAMALEKTRDSLQNHILTSRQE